MRTHVVGWLENSYAVPKEVGKVGVQSPTFIEPVQKRKDGIEAMFSRQTKAAQQQKSASRDTPPGAAAAESGKRKRESSSPTEEMEEEKETGTSVSPSSPAKRSKIKNDPIKHDDTVESSEGTSDVEILLSGPSPSSSQNETRRSKAAKPKAKKEEDDITTPTGSQQSQQQRQMNLKKVSDTLLRRQKSRSCQPISLIYRTSFQSATPSSLPSSPRKNNNKKQEKTELSLMPSRSTPKITSFFAKTAQR
jgi:hypothetical protein